jgi:L-threonylcarbamoyladenylate synthase
VRLDPSDPAALAAAAQLLADGERVAFPTETVYGLGARADDDRAVEQIFRAKGRPAAHPLIVHVAHPGRVATFARDLPDVAARLMAAFWPGPLTVILPRVDGMAGAAAGGQRSIGLRCPAHPVAQRLLELAFERGVPGVAAPSANRFGRVSPTTADHVLAEFGDTLAVLDGGACRLGIESAIVDCTRGRPVLLRPGPLTRAQLEAAAGEPLADADADSGAPRAPGTLATHYAPDAAVRLMSRQMLHTALHMLGEQPLPLAVYSTEVPPPGVRGIVHRRMPLRADEAAHELFAVLRAFDAEGVKLIWVEEPPAQPEWDGVRDRLIRAAAR